MVVVLCDSDFRTEIDVLDAVEELYPLLQWTLECFTSANKPHSSGAFVDDSGSYGIVQVGGSVRLSAGIDESDATHVSVGYLIAA